MFKKMIFSWMLVALCISLTACGSSVVPVGTPSTSSGLILQDKLGLGIIQLAETDLAITSQQAADLLPLWKAVKTLKTDQTYSQAETLALYQQIEKSLTQEQIQAINDLNWSQAELSALTQKYAATAPQNTASQSTSTTTGAAEGQPMDAPMGGGGAPAGDMGGDMPVEMQSGNTQTQTTPQAVKSIASVSVNLNLLVADTVVTLLQKSAGL